MVNINVERIPEILRQTPHWCLWKLETNGNRKETKVPYQPDGKYASVSDLGTLNNFDVCLKALESEQFSGIGFVFTNDMGIVGIDLDACLAADGAEIRDWADKLYERFKKTYAEITPSGRGLHFIARGRPIVTGSKKFNELRQIDDPKDPGIEVYNERRFFTFTSNAITVPEIVDCQDELDWIYNEYYAEKYNEPSEVHDTTGNINTDILKTALNCTPADDYEIWIKMGLALKGSTINDQEAFELWNDWSKKSTKYDYDACLYKWQHNFKNPRSGLGTIFYFAKENGFKLSDWSRTIDYKNKEAQISVVRAHDLIQQQLHDLRWVVDSILPEGLTIFAGSPKIGKSWFALALANAVSMGHKFLDTFHTTPSETLYLALEDNSRRLRDRLKILTKGNDSLASNNLCLSHSIPPLDKGGLNELIKWLDNNQRCRLVIIDTLGRFSSVSKGQQTAYDHDYRDLAPLQKLALSRQIAIIVITHLRKTDAEDPLMQITGSTGITGAADGIWLLKRGRNEARGTLIITGRDVEEQTLGVQFDSSACEWKMLGNIEISKMGQERFCILEVLKDTKRPMGPTEIAEILGQKEDNIKSLLSKMVIGGQVSKLRRGQYLYSMNYLDDLVL